MKILKKLASAFFFLLAGISLFEAFSFRDSFAKNWNNFTLEELLERSSENPDNFNSNQTKRTFLKNSATQKQSTQDWSLTEREEGSVFDREKTRQNKAIEKALRLRQIME